MFSSDKNELLERLQELETECGHAQELIDGCRAKYGVDSYMMLNMERAQARLDGQRQTIMQITAFINRRF